MTRATAPQAGWYADPAREAEYRLWDGQAWTAQTWGNPPAVKPAPRKNNKAITMVGVAFLGLVTLLLAAPFLLAPSSESSTPRSATTDYATCEQLHAEMWGWSTPQQDGAGVGPNVSLSAMDAYQSMGCDVHLGLLPNYDTD